jgi:hypothetical protein
MVHRVHLGFSLTFERHERTYAILGYVTGQVGLAALSDAKDLSVR